MLQKLSFYFDFWLNLVIAFCLSFLIIGHTLPAKADVIYQAFDQPFQEIENQLPQLKADGFTYIQISPPQKSHPSEAWWGRYQPIDFAVIEGPLGNKEQLKSLINKAHQEDLKILVDVIFNHMANYGDYPNTLNYPHYSPQDFHPKTCMDNDQDPYVLTHGWLSCNLPDLNTESKYVRKEAKNYLNLLLDLGVDGFRIDTVKHVEPEFFEEVLAIVPADKYVYGEVLSGNPDESYLYTGIHGLDSTDYPLLGTLKKAFSLGGDLRSLIDPVSFRGALRGSEAVTFAKTHDTIPGGESYDFYGFDERDQMLANAYVLARQDGTPLIFRDDANDPIVQAGSHFHEQLLPQPQYFRNGKEIAQGGDSPNLLFIERGDQGIAMVNKAGEAFAPTVAKMPGLAEGCYEELVNDLTMCIGVGDDGQKYVSQWNSTDKGGLDIPPRSALFFVKQD